MSVDPVLTHLQAWANQRAAVRAMLLTSTRAIPGGRVDALSDYDVILVVTDIEPFHADRAWMNDFGRVLVTYWDAIHPDPDFGLPMFANVIQYESGLRIDFTVWPVALLQQVVQALTLPAELDAGYVILLDKDALTAGLRAPSLAAYQVALPSEADYQRHIEEFFSDAPAVAKFLWRGDLFPAKWGLDFDMKHVYLRPVLEWLAVLDHPGAKIGALGKGLQRYLSAGLWAALEDSYTGASVADNWAALYQTLALFRRAAAEVGARLGYAYPLDLDQRVVRYVQQIEQMAPAAAEIMP